MLAVHVQFVRRNAVIALVPTLNTTEVPSISPSALSAKFAGAASSADDHPSLPT